MEQLRNFLRQLVIKVGNFTFTRYEQCGSLIIKNGNHNDIASEVDQQANSMFIREIQKNFAAVGLITEEAKPINPDAEIKIYVDPLDGSKNFKHRSGFYAVMAAVTYNDKTVYSFIYNPILRWLCEAETNKGAYLKGFRIKVSQKKKLEDCHILTNDSLKPNRINPLNRLHKLNPNLWVPSIGSCGISAMLVAEGEFDIFVSNGNGGVWDHLPIIHMVQESGGVATRLDGRDWKFEMGVPYFLSNPNLVEPFLELMSSK
jgi:myo-inositol-1(or 4)-monophosphatase